MCGDDLINFILIDVLCKPTDGRRQYYGVGGFTFHHSIHLHVFRQHVTAAVYTDNVLHPHVAPLFEAQPKLQVFQQDNTHRNTACVSVDFLIHNNIDELPALAISFYPIWHRSNMFGTQSDRELEPEDSTLQELDTFVVR